MTTLTVRAADYTGEWAQAEVRDRDLRLFTRLAVGVTLEVPPGQYFVSLASPAAPDFIEGVDIQAGEDAVVTLGDETTSPGDDPLPAADEAFAGAEATADGDAAPPLAPAPEAAPALPWRIRLLSGRDGRPVAGPSIPLVSAAEGRELDVSGLGTLGPPEPLFVQVAVPGGRARNVAVPEDWSVRVRLAEGDVAARAVPPPGGYVEMLATYLQAGQVREAADMGAGAERLLRGKVSNPLGAIIGGYALLRMGEVELMHDWPYNLSAWFDWLPDGAVIAAELALLQDDRERAAEQLEQAAERGVPVFAEGLSLLSRRVREGLVETEAARRIAALTPFAELGQLTVAVPGLDPTRPADTQQPLDAFPSGDGWHAFTGTQED
jgi:hypothetical protein